MLSDQPDRDPSTGDYVVVNGAPVRTTSPTVPAFIRTRCPRQGWMHAPDSLYGSSIAKVRRFTGKRNGAATALENATAQALQPMVDAQEIQDARVTAVNATRQGVALQIDLLDNNGEPQQLVLSPIGG